MAFAKYAFHSSSIIRQFVRLKDFLIGYFFIIIFFHFFVNIPIHSSVLGWKTGVCFQYSIFWGLVFTHLTCFPHLVCDFSQGRLVSHHRFKVNTLLTQFLTLTGRMSLSFHKFVFRWATAKRAANHVIPLLLNMSDRRTVPQTFHNLSSDTRELDF